MSVASVHADYENNQDWWRTIRDVMSGDRVVKQAGERYVSKLEGQSDSEFRAYVERGFFYNATARTVSGFLGMIFRREPVVKLPDKASVLGKALGAFENDCDLQGKDIAGYAREVVSEVTILGRAGTLVDWLGDGEDRAYWSFYRAEDILNWREERINGRLQLTLVVLREVLAKSDATIGSANEQQSQSNNARNDSIGASELRSADTPGFDGSGGALALRAFEANRIERLRVLRLVPSAGVWRYQVELWEKDRNGNQLNRVETVVPVRRGKALPNIPFVFHGPNLSKASVEQSPISDIVAANLDHYRMNADFKHGMHYTALPTAWVAGFPNEAVLRVGSSAAWVTDTIGASAGFLEFKGDGLRTFERAMDRVERLLAVLGARLLESQKRVSESAEALQLRQAGDSSVIAGLANAVSKSLNQALRWVYWWHSTEEHPDEVSCEQVMIEINRNFDLIRLTGKEIQALVMAWQSMAISQDTMLHQFERGDVLPPGRSPEEELALIKASPPPVQASVALLPADRGQGGYG